MNITDMYEVADFQSYNLRRFKNQFIGLEYHLNKMASFIKEHGFGLNTIILDVGLDIDSDNKIEILYWNEKETYKDSKEDFKEGLDEAVSMTSLRIDQLSDVIRKM